MNAKIEEIITQLKDLSLIEATELVKQIEEVFDVDIHNHSLYFYATKNNSKN